MSLPDFLIIGVPKAGSTALHTALAQHPQLFMSAVKEPKFFLCDGPPPRRGGPGDAQTYQEYLWRRTDYEQLFANAPGGVLRGESTPFYLYDRAAHRRIRALLPEAKLIAMLRDPIDRAHSNWAHLRTAGLEPFGDFMTACAAEERRAAAGWAPFWRYMHLGRYGEQLAHLLQLFPREQVLLLRYRNLLEQPAVVLDSICSFLNVTSGVIGEVPPANVTTQVPDSAVQRLVRALLRRGAAMGQHVPPSLRTTAHRPLLSILQHDGHPRRPLTTYERTRLMPYFADDIRLLERVSGNDYSDWLTITDASTERGATPDGRLPFG